MSDHERGAGGSVGATVYAALRDALRAGVYRPGDRLREEEIARRFRVSRTPVREALARLQSRGLVEMAERRGLRVRVLRERDVLDLYQIRGAIEGAAAGLAAVQTSPFELEALRDLNQALAEAGNDSDAMARLDRLFHDAVYRLARNSYLDMTLDELGDAVALLGPSLFTWPGHAEKALREHEAILEAIAERAPDRAEAAARAHIRSALRTRLEVMQAASGTD